MPPSATRLAIVDALWLGDASPGDVGEELPSAGRAARRFDPASDGYPQRTPP
jgi:hypothetical protein